MNMNISTHATFYCIHHPSRRWHTKWQAVSSNGGYSGLRRLFYDGAIDAADPYAVPECSCPSSDLRLIEESQKLFDNHPELSE